METNQPTTQAVDDAMQQAMAEAEKHKQAGDKLARR